MSQQSFHKWQQHYIIPILLVLLNISVCLLIYFFYELQASQSNDLVSFYAFKDETQKRQYIEFVQFNIFTYLIICALQLVALFSKKSYLGIFIVTASFFLFYYSCSK